MDLNSLPRGRRKPRQPQKKSSTQELEQNTSQLIQEIVLPDIIPEEKEDILTSQNVIFKPNKGPQTDFLAAKERQVLYGGSAGGEPKSWFYRLLSQ